MIKSILASVGILALMLALTACGGGDSEPPSGVKMPESASDFEGQSYQDVVGSLEEAGFTNVEAVPLGNLITGWLTDEDSVDVVDADGTTDFSADEYFDADAKIVVTYNSFPEEEEEGGGSESSEPEKSSSESITAENNPEFAAILTTTDYCSAGIAAFADSNTFEPIEFDGNIGAINSHDGAATRYDILLGSGDFNPNSQPGPAFQLRDVNITSDLNLTGDNIPDSLTAGLNVHIEAVITEFEESSCLLLLAPIETRIR